MKTLHEKILDTDYRKLARRFVVIAVLFAIIGGITGAVLLRPQISDMIVMAENHEQITDVSGAADQSAVYSDPAVKKALKTGKHAVYEKKAHEHENDWEHAFKSQITPVSKGKLIALGIIGICGLILAAAYWLLIAAWLYKAADKAKMHSLIWFLAGLAGNLAAVAVFLVLRNLMRVRCSRCGSWERKGRFCAECGSEFEVTCLKCGTDVPAEDHYCSSCGALLQEPDGKSENGSKTGSDDTEESRDSDTDENNSEETNEQES